MADKSDTFQSVDEMRKLVNSLFYVGGKLKGFPPTISPALEDYEFMQYAQQPKRPAAGNFRILMNVNLYQIHEIEVHVLGKKVLEIRGAHQKRQNRDALWMSRKCNYTYHLPDDAVGKELHAEWTNDDYLHIQATSASCKEDGDKVRIVIKRVSTNLKPVVEMSTVNEMAEDIRDSAKRMLHYMGFPSAGDSDGDREIPPGPGDPKQQEKVRPAKDFSSSSGFNTSISSEDLYTQSSEKETSK